MKNSKPASDWLDACQAINEMTDDELQFVRLMRDERALWYAARAAGWTIAELDAAYERRFGLPAGHVARLRGKG